jgi:hypothetical protein
MIGRCYETEHIAYKSYGGRGIRVCDRWKDIKNFVADMDATYEKGLTLDRRENDGDYTPANCRWATKSQQARNTHRTRFVVLNELEKYNYPEFCEMIDKPGLTPKVLANRLDRLGWSIDRAVNTPVRKQNNRKRADIYDPKQRTTTIGKQYPLNAAKEEEKETICPCGHWVNPTVSSCPLCGEAL